jgi:hypothetical protein
MNLNEEFGDFVGTVRQLRGRAAQLSAASAIADITVSPIRRLTEQFADGKTKLDVLRQTPGIGAHAKAATNLPGNDIAADYAAIVAAIDTVIADVYALVPKTGQYASVVSMETDGQWTDRPFTVAQTAGLRTVLDTFVAGLPTWIDRQA